MEERKELTQEEIDALEEYLAMMPYIELTWRAEGRRPAEKIGQFFIKKVLTSDTGYGIIRP